MIAAGGYITPKLGFHSTNYSLARNPVGTPETMQQAPDYVDVVHQKVTHGRRPPTHLAVRSGRDPDLTGKSLGQNGVA